MRPSAPGRILECAGSEQRGRKDEAAKQRKQTIYESSLVRGVSQRARRRRMPPSSAPRALFEAARGFAPKRTVDEAEIFLEAQPEYADALQTSTVLVNVLIDHGGLEYEEYDETGEKLTEARIEGFREQGLSEDEIYDAIERRCVRATEEGRAVTNLLDPVERVRSLPGIRPLPHGSASETARVLLDAPNARGNQRAVRRRPRAHPTRENKLAARSCELPHRSHERGRRALLGTEDGERPLRGSTTAELS